MRLLELHIDGFGKFHDRTISFNDGINIIYGKNEAGKSTLHTFIRGMLFGIERGRGRAAKNDLYTKYEPWENSGTSLVIIRIKISLLPVSSNSHFFRYLFFIAIGLILS